MIESSKTKRRWLQYSLRTLLVIVTIGAAGFGWLGMKVRAKQREREIVKAIRELDGQVSYDRHAPGPVWMQQWLGDDIFTPVNMVFCWQKMTDAELARIGELHQLEEIYLTEAKVTDAGLVHLRGLKKLRSLILEDTDVTDAGMVHLQGLTELDDLDLLGTKVTDAGLMYLQGCKQLRRLHVKGTQVTDAGCAKLQKALPNLQIDR